MAAASSEANVLHLQETVEACQVEMLEMQKRINALEAELVRERKVRRQLEEEAATWAAHEKQLQDRVTELRERASFDSRMAVTEEEGKRIDMMKKSQEENMAYRRKIDDLKNRNEALDKQAEHMRRRMQEKDQTAEMTYQKSLKFQELQSKQFTLQINKMIKEQERERNDYENQLAVKDQEMQALEAQQMIRSDMTKHTAEASVLQPSGPSDSHIKLREEADRLRLELEKVRSEKDSRIRELQHALNKVQAETDGHVEKCERLERTAHSRHLKIGQLQTRIATAASEMRDLEVDRDTTIAKMTGEMNRASSDAKRTEDTMRHESVSLKETIEQLRGQLDQQDRSTRDQIRSLEDRHKIALQRSDDDALAKSRAHDDALRELASSRDRADDASKQLQRSKEERNVMADDLHRAVNRAHDLERELRSTTEASTKLAERDAKLLSERDTLKVYVGQCKLELEKASRERHRLAQRLNDTERKLVLVTQGATSQQLLAICSKPAKQTHRSDVASALSLRRGVPPSHAASFDHPPTAEEALMRYPSARLRSSLGVGSADGASKH